MPCHCSCFLFFTHFQPHCSYKIVPINKRCYQLSIMLKRTTKILLTYFLWHQLFTKVGVCLKQYVRVKVLLIIIQLRWNIIFSIRICFIRTLGWYLRLKTIGFLFGTIKKKDNLVEILVSLYIKKTCSQCLNDFQENNFSRSGMNLYEYI